MKNIKTFEGFLNPFKKKSTKKTIAKIFEEDLDTIQECFLSLEDSGYDIDISLRAMVTKNIYL